MSYTGFINDSTITLEQPVEWGINSQIVITSTDFYDDQTEQRIIIAKSGDGRTLTLNSPLNFMHWGSTHDLVSEQAEVALLSRTILIKGDDSSEASLFGAQVQANGGGIMRIEGTEFYGVGQVRNL